MIIFVRAVRASLAMLSHLTSVCIFQMVLRLESSSMIPPKKKFAHSCFRVIAHCVCTFTSRFFRTPEFFVLSSRQGLVTTHAACSNSSVSILCCKYFRVLAVTRDVLTTEGFHCEDAGLEPGTSPPTHAWRTVTNIRENIAAVSR